MRLVKVSPLVGLAVLSACGATSPRSTSITAPSPEATTLTIAPVAAESAWSPPSNTLVPEDATGPARRVLETAQQMLDDDVVVRGSCYRYVDDVFERAGYRGWRHRTYVFRGNRRGPYADLDLIQPGDWLWIVNHPDMTPVGTHSVLFVGWEDRASGYARVVSYVGGNADRGGDYVSYDVSRTYAIQRAVDAEDPPRRRRPRGEARAREPRSHGGSRLSTRAEVSSTASPPRASTYRSLR